MAVDKIHLVHSMTLPIPIKGVCFMTPFSLSTNCFEYYSTFFFMLLLERNFPGITFVMLLFGMARSDVRAAVDVVCKNSWTGCMLKAGLVLNEPYFLLYLSGLCFRFRHTSGSVPGFNRLLFLQLGPSDTEADLQFMPN